MIFSFPTLWGLSRAFWNFSIFARVLMFSSRGSHLKPNKNKDSKQPLHKKKTKTRSRRSEMTTKRVCKKATRLQI